MMGSLPVLPVLPVLEAANMMRLPQIEKILIYLSQEGGPPRPHPFLQEDWEQRDPGANSIVN